MTGRATRLVHRACRSLLSRAVRGRTHGRTTQDRTTQDQTTQGRTTQGRTTQDRTTQDRTTDDRTTHDPTLHDPLADGGERGGTWGEAILSELDQIERPWAAVRWTIGGILVARRERRGRSAAVRPVAARPRLLRRTVVAAAVGAVAALGISQFVLGVSYIPSGSMSPTIEVGDRVLVDRMSLRLVDPGYGDLVLLHSAVGGGRRTLIKRVIGRGGDRIECHDGQVFRNGQALTEHYLRSGTRTECTARTVPHGTFYVMGDNREVSQDSRLFGPVPAGDLTGRVLAAAWPPHTLNR